jgi:hypothetical protein
MSDPGNAAPPPPGWQPPPPPPPGYQSYPTQPPPPPGHQPGHQPYPAQSATYPTHPQPAGSWAPPPGMLGAAHKPGAMPLRPLGLGDMYDAAFRIIRFNPKATVGSAVLVAAIAMAVPVLVTALLTATIDIGYDESSAFLDDEASLAGVFGSLGSLVLGAVLASFGTILVTGMISHVTAAAAIGRRLTLGEAWAATRGKRWRLIGLALLLGLIATLAVAVYVVLWVVVVVASSDNLVPIVVWGLVTVPLFLCAMVWFWVRVYYLPVPALMLEPIGVFEAVGRAFRLTRKQFWRTFGIALLTLVVVGVAGNILAFPIGFVGQLATIAVGTQYALLVLVVTQALSQVVTAAFVTPFTSAVTSLQYLDQRMRKEAYDVELMQQAGITGT